MLRPGDPPAQSLALAAGLALIEAVDVAAPDQPLTLKWPNDLMIGDRKLAGILLERSGDRVVLGFGVNLAAAPNLEDRRAASLGGVIAPMAFAPLLAASFDRLLALWRSNDSLSMIHAWQERAHRVGTELAVHLNQDEKLSGRFDGLEPDGALRLRVLGDEVRVIRAADVEVC